MLKQFIYLALLVSFSTFAQEPGTPSKLDTNDQPNKTLLDSPVSENRTISLKHPLSDDFALPLSIGHSEISASFNHTHTYAGTNRASTRLGFWYSRFVADGISIGGAFAFESERGKSFSLIGGLGSYYFYQADKKAARVSIEALKGLTDGSGAGRLKLDLSYEYFPNPNVSFGPYVAFARFFRSSGRSDYNRLYFGARFSLYFL